jgi:uncharacterized FlgJ-related protein
MGLNEMFKKIASIESEKMELGKHEVELAIVDDIKKLADSSDKFQKNFIASYKTIVTESTKAIEQGTAYVDNAKKLTILLQEFQAKGKELGLNVNDNPIYKNAENILVKGDIDAVMQRVFDLRKIN